MDHSQNILFALVAILIFACVTETLPSARAVDSDAGDLSHLMKLLGKLKSLNAQRSKAWDTVLNSADSSSGSSDSISGAAAENAAESAAVSSAEKLAALKRGFMGFNKRQGAWSYDYGLGGGRFGKRYYGDYGIGGGRFGRDVDHVDVADTNDVTL